VGQPSPVPIPGSDPSGEGEDQPVTVTVVRPNKEKVTIATTMNTTVETFILQFVMTVTAPRPDSGPRPERGAGATEEEQMDLIRSLRFVDARGRQWGQDDKVGIYITPEEVREGTNKVYELYRVRGGAPKPSKQVQKDTGKRRDKLILAKAKLDQVMLRRMRTPLAQELFNKAAEIRDSPDTYAKQLIAGLDMDKANELIDFINENTGDGKHAERSMSFLCHFFYPQVKGVDVFLKELEEAKQQVYTAFNYKVSQTFMDSAGRLKLTDIIDEVEEHKLSLQQLANQHAIQQAAQQQAEAHIQNMIQHVNMQVIRLAHQ
jgi:hypothetical protein